MITIKKIEFDTEHNKDIWEIVSLGSKDNREEESGTIPSNEGIKEQ